MKFLYNLQEPLFGVGNIDVQVVARPINYKHSFKNGREKHGFIYVVDGAIIDTFCNSTTKTLCAEKGELVFIPQGSIYTGIYTQNNTKVQIVQFELISGSLPEYLSKPTKINLPNAQEFMEAFFRPLTNRMSSHPFFYLSCLYELLWKIDERYIEVPKKYRKLQPALSEILEFWHENRKISYYAKLCNISEAHFRKLFREYIGMSPVDYRNDIRLSNARNKLQSGEFSVSEAAYESGFSNLSFFTRLYKKKYGHTPGTEL